MRKKDRQADKRTTRDEVDALERDVAEAVNEMKRYCHDVDTEVHRIQDKGDDKAWPKINTWRQDTGTA